jgi:hypothetical protein
LSQGTDTTKIAWCDIALFVLVEEASLDEKSVETKRLNV